MLEIVLMNVIPLFCKRKWKRNFLDKNDCKTSVLTIHIHPRSLSWITEYEYIRVQYCTSIYGVPPSGPWPPNQNFQGRPVTTRLRKYRIQHNKYELCSLSTKMLICFYTHTHILTFTHTHTDTQTQRHAWEQELWIGYKIK